MRAALLLVALAACHFHRDVNAPGVIDPLAPPTNLTSTQPEYPGDPGEHRLVLTTGVLGGGGGGSFEDRGFFELAGEVTLSYGQSEVTHNDHAMNLLPKGIVLPPRSYGLTLGWSGLRVVKDPMTDDSQAKTGPLYVEGQTAWAGFVGFGGGVAFDPKTGAAGPQVQGHFTIYYLRARVLFGDDGGWEVGGGLQIKIPTTWVWRRK